jgi:putative chitinase
MAAFVGQLAHESALFSRLEENLTYSTAERLMEVWPSVFPTQEAARPFVKNPAALAEKVYGGRMGNKVAGDAFKYRGRGLIQLTGKEAYVAYMMASGSDAVNNPDALLKPACAADSAGWFWSKNGCNAFADKRDWTGLTRRINGGTKGFTVRIALTQKAMKALGVS